MKIKCKCLYPNNQPVIRCDSCVIKEEFNNACGYTETDWKSSKRQLNWEFEVWIRSRELMIQKFNDFVKGVLT